MKLIENQRKEGAARTSATRTLARRVGVVVAAAGIGGAVLVGAASPASATAGNCSWGYNNANTAWGHCDRTVNNGYYGFRLVVNCYYYNQRVSYGSAPQSIYASCPSWSHVTYVHAEPYAM